MLQHRFRAVGANKPKQSGAQHVVLGAPFFVSCPGKPVFDKNLGPSGSCSRSQRRFWLPAAPPVDVLIEKLFIGRLLSYRTAL